MSPKRVWLSWKQIEAAARAGISCRTGRRVEREAAAAGWSATLEQAHARALAHLAETFGDDPSPGPAARLARHEDAIELYRAMLAALPADAAGGHDADMLASARADINLWLGHALRIVGRYDEAVQAYRAAAAACSGFGDAYWSLANLKTYRFADSEISAMRAALAGDKTEPADCVHLSFALGKALEDRADFAGAWDSYARGNALQRAANDSRAEVFEAGAATQIRMCDARFFEARRGWGHPAPDPIFILGLPRSGSTLIEQILASHSAIDGTRELLAIERIAFDLEGPDPDPRNPRYPAVLERLSAGDCRRLGERYLTVTRAHRRERPFFIDKMPNNFAHIALIALILPKARIIDARRDPMACCVSNLKQLFAAGQEFSYSIPDVARYYRTYLQLMRHWDRVLPGKVLRVCHEDMVQDPEAQIRRILAHCGLPFEASCLAFHETRRSVHTPSSEQVRRPINREGLEQWRNFAFALDPLKAALGDALADWRS